MKTQYYTAVSLDGFIADPNNSLEWLMQLSEGPGEGYDRFIRDVGALAMGSTTYEWILDQYMYKDTSKPKQWIYEQPAWVFTSRKLREVPGAKITFVKGDVRPVHEAMRAAAGDKNIWLVGGGELVGLFHDQGLLDEIFVSVASVTLGGGAPLLPRRITNPPLKLLSAVPRGDSFVEIHYHVIHPQRLERP